MSQISFTSLEEACKYIRIKLEEQKFSEAESLCRGILVKIPGCIPALLFLAIAVSATGRTGLAANLLDQVLKSDPDNHFARENRLRLAQALGEPLGSGSPAVENRARERGAGQVTVLLCGQIREPWLFQEFMRVYILMQQAGIIDRIVLSTWKAELEQLGGTCDRLREYGVELVANDEPVNFQVSGNYFHQTCQLYSGLQEIDSDSWVFKTRPDVFLTFDNLQNLFQSVMALPPVAAEPRVFSHRIWVPYFEVTQPFFISDVVFFGKRNDLLKLCSFDSSYEALNLFKVPNPQELQKRAAAAETRKYLSVFVDNFPILNEFKDVWQYAEYYMTARDAVLDYNSKHQFYREYFALYLYIMNTYFAVGRPYYDGDVRIIREVTNQEGSRFNSSGSQHFVNTVDPDKFFESIFLIRNRAGQAFCNTSVWLEQVFAGKIIDPYQDFYLDQPLAAALAYRNTPQRRQAFVAYREALRQLTLNSTRMPYPDLI